MDCRPTFLGIGVQGGGTTWLAGCLQQHPEICMERKELHFFNNHYNTKGWKWYETHFQPDSKSLAYGEWTPEYIFNDNAFKRICRDLKDIKILAMFRNPVDRTYSQYWRYRVAGFTKLDFNRAIQEYPFFINRSMYFENWTRYVEHFGQENCLPLFFEEVKEKPAEEFSKICRFLGVDHSFQPDFNKPKKNEARFNRSQKLVDVITSIKQALFRAGLEGVVTGFKKLHVKELLERMNKKKTQYPFKLSVEERKHLWDLYFYDDIRKFSQYIEKDLSMWNCT
jgi:hypothetical protein